MAQYQLTPEEVYNVIQQAYEYHQIEGTTSQWCPTQVKDGFKHYQEYWYKTVVMGRPIESRDLKELHAYTAALEKDTVNIVWHHMDLELPLTDVLATQGGAFDIRSLSLRGASRQLARQQDYFVYNGSATPSINGLFADAGSTSTASGNWNTAPDAHAVILDMVADLLENDFFKPYALILGDPLAPGLDFHINVAPVTDITQEDAVKKLTGGGIYIDKQTPATPSEKTVYPLPACTTNDGVALLVKPDPGNFNLIVEHPMETLIGEFDTRRKAFPISMVQAMTIQVIETGAISKHVSVDL